MKNIRTQKFKIFFKNGEIKSFLLMPNEVKEFFEISERVNPHYAFERLCGRFIQDMESFELCLGYITEESETSK